MHQLSDQRRRVGIIAGASAAALAVVAIGFGVQAANAGTLPACSPSQVNVTTSDFEAGMGHRQFTYTVENTSAEACVVHGAPSEVNQTDDVRNAPVVGSTYFTRNTADQWIRLDPGQAAKGDVAWSTPSDPGEAPYLVGIVLPGLGQLDTGYRDATGTSDGYTVTNLRPAPASK